MSVHRGFTDGRSQPIVEVMPECTRRTRPAAFAALLVAIALLAAGCIGGSSAAAPRPPHCAPPSGPVPEPIVAEPVALAYLHALATHRYDRAQHYAHACSAAQQRSLDRLWLWLDSMPSQQVRVTEDDVATVRGGVVVRATLYARFGPAPYSEWVTLGPRTLRLTAAKGRYHVRADISPAHRSDIAAYGVSSIHHPYFINGQRVTVVYARPDDVTAAQAILATAESAVPRLAAVYGGGQAGLRPVIFLVDQRRQGELLAHVDLGKVRTPAGFQYSSFAYVDLAAWRKLPDLQQRSMVVHELTHVATRPMLAGAPHSLLEGIAMDEENRYLKEYGQTMYLESVAAAYRSGRFPSLRIWERRQTDWGLPSVRAIQLCYLDGLVMTHVIVTEHGGVPALARLGAAFRAEHARRDFTAAQVERAFRAALGTSFQQVVAQAHAFARQMVLQGD
jgi:hypothetical protein